MLIKKCKKINFRVLILLNYDYAVARNTNAPLTCRSVPCPDSLPYPAKLFPPSRALSIHHHLSTALERADRHYGFTLPTRGGAAPSIAPWKCLLCKKGKEGRPKKVERREKGEKERERE